MEDSNAQISEIFYFFGEVLNEYEISSIDSENTDYIYMDDLQSEPYDYTIDETIDIRSFDSDNTTRVIWM